MVIDGIPAGDDPIVGTWAYLAPEGNLVLYSGDQTYYDGLVRVCTIRGDLDAAGARDGEFKLTVRRAG